MKDKLPELKDAVDHILDELDKGYEEAAEIVESIDKKGY